MHEFTVFEFVFNDEKIENEFIKFFKVNNLYALFNNEHKATPIKVRLPDAQSVINNSGKYAKDLKNFSDLLSMAQNNQKFDHSNLKILKTATSFQKMMNIIRNILKQYEKTLPEHLFNFWNIVYYNKDLF